MGEVGILISSNYTQTAHQMQNR